jgi:hypothetical protein
MATPTPQDQAEINKLYNEYISLLQQVNNLSYIDAQQKADAAKATNTLSIEIDRVKRDMNDIVFQSEYLYRSFQETTAELKNQNNLLKIGRSLFSQLTDVAQKLTNFQKGYTDLREKDFKKLQSSFKIQKDENEKIINDLGQINRLQKRETQIKNLEDQARIQGFLTTLQTKRLNELKKEQALYDAALDAQENGIPILEKELSLTKSIGKARQDIGGLAGAGAEVLSKFGGSLTQYLDINEASEAVSEFNKKVIDDALKQKSVLTALNQIEQQKLQLEQDILDKQAESAQELVKINKLEADIVSIKKLRNDQQSLSNSLNAQSVADLEARKNLVQSILQSTALDQAAQDNINNKLTEQIDLQQRLDEIASRQPEITQELNDVIQLLANSQNLNAQEINDLTARRNDLSTEQNNLITEQTTITGNLATIQNDVNALLDQTGALHSEINNKLNTQVSLTNDLTQAQTNQANALAVVKQKTATLSADQNKLEEKAYQIKEAAIKGASTGLTGFINKFKSLGVLVNNLNFTKVFTDPAVLLTTLISLGFKANSQAVELGKSLGMSAEKAGELREEAAKYARETNDTFVNTDRLLKAQSELSKELGIAVKFSNEELATFAKLTELTGLTAQEAGKLALASKAAGIPTEDYADSIREAAFYAQQSTGTHFDSKEILQDVAKLSAGILVKFQNNPKAIGQAVVEAKKLGLTLEQIDKVGESLLNWEQSIENELKAELLTGRELNMERARAAALSGDQLALTQEISSQVGTLNDFQNMNVIAQRSLAEAFGLSREEMAEMLMKQEAINKYGKEAADLNKEQLQALKDSGLSASEFLKKQEQQRTAQAKFQDAMVKLQTVIANLVDGPVGQLLDAIADLSGSVVGILKIFSPILTVVSAISKIILGAISGPIKFIADSVTTVTNGISTAINFVLSGFNKIKSAVSPFFAAIGSFFAPIANFLSPIFSFVSSIGKGLATWVVGFTAISLVSGFVVSKLLSGLKSIATSLFSTTAATTAQTTATVTNTTATRLNAAQMQIYTAQRAAGVPAQVAYTAAQNAGTTATITNTTATNTGTLASIRSRIATIAHNAATAISTGLQYAWNVAKGLGIAIMNSGLVTWLAEKAAIIGNTIATNASYVAQGAWNLVKGVGNLLMKTAIGQWLAEKAAIVVSTIAKWANVGATAAVSTASAAAATSTTALGTASATSSGGITALGASLGAFGAAAAPAIPVILALGAALLMATPAIYVLGEVIKSIAVVIGNVLMKALDKLPAIIDSVAKGFVTIFSTLATNWQILIPVGVGLMSIAAGMTLLGTASIVAFPGLLLGAAGLSALSAGLFVLSLAKDNINGVAESIKKLSDIDVTNLATIGPALIGVGAGLAALGAGGVIEAIGSFFAGDPAEKIADIAASGEGLQQTSTALQTTSTAIAQLNASLVSLDISKLFLIGPALMMIGEGLKSLSGGDIVNTVSLFFTGDPIEKLERLASIGDKLKDLPSIFQTIVSSVTQLNTSLSSLDVSKLDAIGPALANIGIGLASLGAGGIMEAIGSFFAGDPAEKIASIAASGDGLQQTSNSLQTTSAAITQLNTSLASLDVSKLFLIGPALMMIGEGLKSLSGGGITDTLGSLLTGDPIEKLERLIAIGDKLKDFPSVFQTVVLSVTQLNASLASLDISKLDAIGPAITKIGIGLASLGVGNAIDSISSLFAGDPIEKLERLAATSDGLQTASSALQSIAIALMGVSAALTTIDVSKLESLSEFEPNKSSKSIFGSITDLFSSPAEKTNETGFAPTPVPTPISTPIKTTNETITNTIVEGGKEKGIEAPTINAGGIDLTPMVNALNEVKAAVTNLQNRPVKLYMDSREITARQLQVNNSI